MSHGPGHRLGRISRAFIRFWVWKVGRQLAWRLNQQDTIITVDADGA